ncbi:acyltransferase family protein [Salinibacterium sp. M195]|uniref:acyltransferase family protein n=1 Tax=Salinibacterium sp. M195 TaxID=2583374 RepID=UPI001C62B915|nr:acyltransferase family protein [Salinibacterium sp. M195]QYH35617.1 acyltransferase [Salinibacterium sp. M195]
MSSNQVSLRAVQPFERAGFRADIHGLRAVAVVLVLVYHAGLPLPGGYIGVDVFFVISGYLITNHLLSELASSSTIRFARFYSKRARRILPASLAVAALTIVGSFVVLPAELLKSVAKDAIATVLYVPNFVFAIRGTDYLAETAASPFQHYWSLGVEEQFYVLWPLLLFVLWRVASKDWVRITLIVAAVTASFIMSVVLVEVSPPWAYFSLPSRAWELGVGALVAIAAGKLPLPSVRLAASFAWLGLAGILFAAATYSSSTQFPGAAALLPVLGAALLIWFGGRARMSGPLVLLHFPVVQFMGTISYSLYLVHWPLIVLLAYLRPVAEDRISFISVAAALCSVPLAWLLFRFVEFPFIRSSTMPGRSPRRVLIVGLVASTAVIAVALGSLAAGALRPTDAGRTATPIVGPLDELVFSEFVPSNMLPSLAEASGSVPSTYASGCHLGVAEVVAPDCVFGDTESSSRVVLFGDSHAAQWFPALEASSAAHGTALYNLTKSSCPSIPVAIELENVPYRACDEWRDNSVAQINELRPSMVIVSNFSSYIGVDGDAISPESWARGYEALRQAIDPTIDVAVISDTPSFPQTPALCLAQHLNDALACSESRSHAIKADFAAANIVSSKAIGAQFVDLTDAFCDSERCGVIVGATLMYRDSHHITVEYSRILSQQLWQALTLR